MIAEVTQLIRQFVSGKDTSIEAANAIESILDDRFADDDYIQQTVEMLAMYRPEGGEFLFDTAAISQRLVETMQYLQDIDAADSRTVNRPPRLAD